MRSFGSFSPYSVNIILMRHEEYSVSCILWIKSVYSFTLVSIMSPFSSKRCNKRNFLKCSWIHFSLIFQNHLIGFCSSSVLPTDSIEELAIALRDMPVAQHPLQSQFIHWNLYCLSQTKAYRRDHSKELCYTVRSWERSAIVGNTPSILGSSRRKDIVHMTWNQLIW